MESFQGKRVLVVGMARSGIAACHLLSDLGASVIANDSKNLSALPDEVKALKELRNVSLHLGETAGSLLDQCDILLISPGVHVDAPFVLDAQAKGMQVLGELELGASLTPAPIVAITGTNGKTTTTSLTGMMFTNGGFNTHVVGNIGDPITAHVLEARTEDVMVAEISSFQMETAPTFHPRVSAILNITPDHMDRHYTMENYINMKARVFANQRGDDVVVLNMDDEPTRALSERAQCKVVFFSRLQEPENGCFVRDGWIIWRIDGEEATICRREEVRIPGDFNLENALAAAACALSMGVSPKAVRYSLAAFEGVEHRLEFVTEVSGVRFINDSKATNPDAASKAVRAMALPTVLIAGGYDKKIPFDDFIQSVLDSKVAAMVLIGDTAEEIQKGAAARGFNAIWMASSLQEAVNKAFGLAKPGYNVLLAPACASFDMFKDYEQRGRMFKDIALGLAQKKG